MSKPNARCIDCGRRHWCAGSRCRSCRIAREETLTDGRWVTGRHGIKRWEEAP